jgi:hypothetical protein
MCAASANVAPQQFTVLELHESRRTFTKALAFYDREGKEIVLKSETLDAATHRTSINVQKIITSAAHFKRMLFARID